MAASLRVSAAARRGAAAYGDGAQRLVEARTHSILANLRCIMEFEVRILHNFLRRSQWHLALWCIMTLLKRIKDPPFWTPPADEHPRGRYVTVAIP